MKSEIEPTPEDWENVRRSLENPRNTLMETLVRQEARRRVEREREERRRARLRRLSFGLLGR
jgi:hypothetical protein